VTWFVLDDWRLDAPGQIDPAFNTRHDLAMDGRWGSAITINGRTDTVLRVRPGERIRLRLLSSANGRVFAPDFGDLDAQVIAVDGLYLPSPVPANGFELAPGNRLDIDPSSIAARPPSGGLGPLHRPAPQPTRHDRAGGRSGRPTAVRVPGSCPRARVDRRHRHSGRAHVRAGRARRR
jgi:FtsP/CotA-like multicopper oxidase with cupredoxin domain